MFFFLLIWILRMNHIVFPCRQYGLAGVMLLRIPSSQNFFWKMASPSWVSLSDILFLSFCSSLSVLPIFYSIFCFSVQHSLIFHQSATLRVISLLLCFPFLASYTLLMSPHLGLFSVPRFFSMRCGGGSDFQNPGFKNVAINLRKDTENIFLYSKDNWILKDTLALYP